MLISQLFTQKKFLEYDERLQVKIMLNFSYEKLVNKDDNIQKCETQGKRQDRRTGKLIINKKSLESSNKKL